MPDYVLETERLRLRRPHIKDSSAMIQLAGDYEVARSTLNIPYPYTPEDASRYIDHVASLWEEGNRFSFSIVLKESDSFIGNIGLSKDERHNCGEIGYWLGKAYWGDGYMTEALKCMLQFGFEEMNLNRIKASYFSDNPASGRVMEKAGMSYEGTQRQAIRKWDSYKDLTLMAILRDEYETTKHD